MTDEKSAKRMYLADVADSRDNNFDVLRLFAASIVLVSHSFFIAGGTDPFGRATGVTLGSLGVALFFAMSGFLILKSWQFQPSVGDFVRKRALRILPALWVVVLLTTLVLGPLVTELPLIEYFTSATTLAYLLLNLVLIPFGAVLPGVFEDNRYPDAVNGSLWTLPIEVSAYVMVAVLGGCGLLMRRATLPALMVGSLVLAWWFRDVIGFQNVRLYSFFLAGMLLYDRRDRVVLSWPLALAGLLIWVLSFNTELLVVTSATSLPYVVMVLAYRTPRWLRRITARGDVSYGLYIYAFPIQQTVSQLLGGTATPLMIMAIALPAAWLCGLVSWKLIERPALRLKPKPRRLTAGVAEQHPVHRAAEGPQLTAAPSPSQV